MPGLQTGIANSWIDEVYATQTPCLTSTMTQLGGTTDTPLSSCLLWLVIGLFVGSVVFKRKA